MTRPRNYMDDINEAIETVDALGGTVEADDHLGRLEMEQLDRVMDALRKYRALVEHCNEIRSKGLAA